MASSLISPGTQVTLINESYYIPATAPTVPLYFIATRADKKQPDGVTPAAGALEHSVVRQITSLNQSVQTYGVPYFRTDVSGNQLHGDARNEYGLFAMNQALNILSSVYAVRADVDLADADVVAFAASTPVFTGIGNGVLSSLSLNPVNVQAETWTLTATSGTVNAGYFQAGTQYKIASNPIVATIAGSFLTGISYTITSVGTTDFTLIGASANTVGVVFTATGPGAGTGVATGLSTDFTLIGAANNSVGTVFTASGPGAGTGTSTSVPATVFTVNGFVSGAQGSAAVGIPYNNGIISFTILAGSTDYTNGDTFTFNISSVITSNPLGANDAAKRLTIVTALIGEINSNTDVRSELYEYNLIVCPGYFETAPDLLNLSLAINEEAFVISDTPFNKSPEDTATWALTNQRQYSQDIAYYYPHSLAANLDGTLVFAAASGTALKTVAYSDSVSEEWYPPAGFRRGVVVGVSDVGYVTGTLGTATTFVSTPLNQGQRDNLYQYNNNINIIPFFPGQGIVVFGQKTSASVASALDRINVMRLMMKIKRDIRKSSYAFLFELNDVTTRDAIKAVIDGYLNDILLRRGLYDYIVICDASNNTNAQIQANELHVSIAVSPELAVEFIYIPIVVTSYGTTLGAT